MERFLQDLRESEGLMRINSSSICRSNYSQEDVIVPLIRPILIHAFTINDFLVSFAFS